MFAKAYDHSKHTAVAIFGDRVTLDDFEHSVACAQRFASDSVETRATPRLVVVVDGGLRVPIDIGQRLAETVGEMPRLDAAFVANSLIARAHLKGFVRLSERGRGRRMPVFTTFQEARSWFVLRGVRGEDLSALLNEARARVCP